MSTCIYTRKSFIIIKINPNSFVVYNKEKDFKIGHTHINNIRICKALIYYCIYGKFKDEKNYRLLKKPYIQESIKRLTL